MNAIETTELSKIFRVRQKEKGMKASSFGLARILFTRAFSLPDLIISGKLDSYLRRQCVSFTEG